MSQENIQTDTPQEGANEQQYASLEEAVFGNINEGSDSVESAFTTGKEGSEETAAPETGQPANQENTQQTSNDETRYQYWQSQADKLKNENQSLKTQMNQQYQQQSTATNEEPAQPANEEFPPPPNKPERPRTFSREEAYSDPASESARYLDAVEDWRDDIAEYNTLKTQYDNAIMQEKFDAIEKQKVEEAQRFEAQQQQAQQLEQVKGHVMGHHGMSVSEAQDFMQKMSDPRSLNVDNLVQLYRMQHGGAVQQSSPAQPSDSFKQVQNAQQVPSPMGVMPSGQTNNDGRSLEDKIMDTMVGNFNSKNPWK